jgi:cell division protein FtsI/penicillin-binding protein 2
MPRAGFLPYYGGVICSRATLVVFSLALLLARAGLVRPETPGLERAVRRSLEGRRGSIVVLDVVSNQVLAAEHLDLAGAALVRPGSTLKPFVLIGLLHAGKLDPQERLVCRRPLRIGSLRLDCSHTADVSELDADGAIAYSCNSYIAQAAGRLDRSELPETLRRAGLDSVTGLAKNESRGRIEPPGSADGLLLTALGARGIEVTPLALLEAYRKLALRKRSGGLSPDQPVFEGLKHAVAYGTAHAAAVEGMEIAGKTGTAAGAGGRTHGLFVGYAPAELPEVAIVVYLPEGRGLDAAAAAQPVLEEALRARSAR